MSPVTCHISISLDGFVAGPDQSIEHPIGVGGMRLHQWVSSDSNGHRPRAVREQVAMHDPGDTPTTVVLVVDDGTEVVVGRVDKGRPDLALVDALVRLQLTARRRGCLVRLRDVSEELRGLLELVGLADVLALEARREA